jgi:DNA-binding CsgD family transcriptional regulator
MAGSPWSVAEGLIGRDREIERLDAVLDPMRDRGGTLLIRGDAGIGKSALLDHARERAGSLGARTLTTVGVESEAELAFAGLHQLLRPITRRMDLLPVAQREVLDAAFGLDATLEPDPYRVALAAYELVCEAAGAAPLLLILDDAQWLDHSSLGALTFIGRRLESEPVVFLASIRDGHATALDDAGFPTLRVESLSDSAAARLLDREAPDLTPTRRSGVLAKAAGNPLALLELARAAPHLQSGAEGLAGAPTLTARLQRAFAWRLDELSTDTHALLLAAALDSNGSLDELLAAATRLNRHAVTVASLDEAAALGFADLADTHVRFRHPLIRSAVQQTASPTQVLTMYGALADAVADPERRLWHRAMAAIGADEQLAAELEAHAQSARRRGAVAVAASALERAALLSDDPHRKGERLVRAAELAYDLGLVDVATRLLREADQLEVGKLEAARLAWLKEVAPGDRWFEHGPAETFVRIAEQMRDGGDPDMALRSLMPIAIRCWWTHARTETRQRVVGAAESVDVAEDDPRLLAVIALAHPEATGPSVRRRIAGTQVSEVADPTAAMDIGFAAGAVGAWATGAPFMARAVEGLREQGRLGMLTQALVMYGYCALYAGDWQAAAAAGAEAARLARDSRQPQFGLAGDVIAAHAAALRGTDEDVEAMLAAPERALIATKSWPLLAPVHLARGAAALGEGRQDDAFEHVWPVFDRSNPVSHRVFSWSAILDLVESGGRGEHAEQVAAVVAELERATIASSPPILVAGLACARPLMASDEEAEPLFVAALDHDLTNYQFLHARTLFSYGSWLRRKRRSAESRQPLRGAHELFDALGAARWSDRARQELRATGETIGPRTPDARDRLTAQELQIAQLAAEGLSNREIGERLFLSHRTIGSHLYRIFPKLGITARAQLRDALAPTQGRLTREAVG